MKIRKILLILPLLVAAATFCPVAHATDLIVKVKDATLYGDTTMITVQAVNNSTKEVSAYSINVTITFADGSKRHLREDYEKLGAYLTDSQDARLSPGGAEEDHLAFRAIPGNPVSSIAAVADVVIFVDRTAQVEDEDSFNRIVTIRSSMAQGKRLAIAAIDKSLADPINPTVLQDTIAQLKPRLDEQQRTHHADFVATHGIGMVLTTLEGMKPSPELGRDAKNLRDYSVRLDKQATQLEVHSKITRVK